MKNAKIFAIFSLFILFLFLATRYDIGRDFQTYIRDFYLFQDSDYGLGRRFSFEYMNYFILTVCHSLNTGPEGYFIVTSFMMCAMFYFIFRDRLFLLPSAILIFLLCGFYTFAINGIRQGLAMFCVINAFTSSKENDKPNIIHYIIWMLIAFLCHNSAIFYLPLYLLYAPKVTKIFNGKILVLMVIVGFLGNQLGLTNLLPLHLFIGAEGGRYSDMASDLILDSGASQLSIAELINLCIYILPLIFADKVEKFYPKSKVNFIIFGFGIALNYIVGSNMLLTRMSYYLLYFNILVYPYLYSYFRHAKNPNFKFFPFLMNVWFIIYFIGKLDFFWLMQMGRTPSVYGINF